MRKIVEFSTLHGKVDSYVRGIVDVNATHAKVNSYVRKIVDVNFMHAKIGTLCFICSSFILILTCCLL